MEKRKAYYISGKNILTWLSVLLILCSAVVRLVLHCEKGTETGSAMVFQILLPIFAEVLFVLIVLFNGKERIYRTAIPVLLLWWRRCAQPTPTDCGTGCWFGWRAWCSPLTTGPPSPEKWPVGLACSCWSCFCCFCCFCGSCRRISWFSATAPWSSGSAISPSSAPSSGCCSLFSPYGSIRTAGIIRPGATGRTAGGCGLWTP